LNEQIQILQNTLQENQTRNEKSNSSLNEDLEYVMDRISELQYGMDALKPLHEYFLVKQRICQARTKLLEDPKIRCYYEVCLTELSGAFLSLFLLQNHLQLIEAPTSKLTDLAASGSIAKDPPEAIANEGYLIRLVQHHPERLNTWITNIKDKALFLLDKIKYFTPLLELIPVYGSGIHKAVDSGVKLIVGANDNMKMGGLRPELVGFTPKTLEHLAEVITQELIFAFKQQIHLLKMDSIKLFAACGVTRVIIALLNHRINPEEDFYASLIKIVHLDPVSQNQREILGYKIPFTEKDLYFDNPGKTAKENDLYRRCGIFYVKSCIKYYFSNDNKIWDASFGAYKPYEKSLVITRATEFDYMQIREGAFNLYQGRVSHDESCRFGQANKAEQTQTNQQQNRQLPSAQSYSDISYMLIHSHSEESNHSTPAPSLIPGIPHFSEQQNQDRKSNLELAKRMTALEKNVELKNALSTYLKAKNKFLEGKRPAAKLVFTEAKKIYKKLQNDKNVSQEDKIKVEKKLDKIEGYFKQMARKS
jgi:hypothetical protein